MITQQVRNSPQLVPDLEDDVLESYEEHHVADVLVMELVGRVRLEGFVSRSGCACPSPVAPAVVHTHSGDRALATVCSPRLRCRGGGVGRWRPCRIRAEASFAWHQSVGLTW